MIGMGAVACFSIVSGINDANISLNASQRHGVNDIFTSTCQDSYLSKWIDDSLTMEENWAKNWRTSDATKDDADSIEKTITIPKLPDGPATYYHATTLENALNIQATNIMTGSKWEGGYIYAWRYKPSKKVLNLSGAASTEVVISFQTYSAFAPDPAFSGNNTDLSLFERLKINAYQPVRSCFNGAIRVSNVQIIE